MNGPGVFLLIAAMFAVLGVFAAVMRAENRRDDHGGGDAHAHVMRLKHGSTWGKQEIQARLCTVRRLIAAIETSPAAPQRLALTAGAEQHPGTAAAAGDANPPSAPPPLPSFDAIAAATAAACEQALAETAELALSFNKPPDGA